MKLKRYAAVLCAGMLLAQPAGSQELSDYLAISAEQNPGVKSAFLEYQSALQKIPQAGTLPDPQLSLGVFLRPMEQMMGDQVAQVSLMQMFPWFGTLDAAKAEASAMARARFNAFREARSMAFYEVKATWYALHLVEEEYRITQETLKIVGTLEAIAVNRFKSGETGPGVATGGRVDSPPAGSISQNAMGEMGASAPKTSMAVGSNMTGEMGGGRSGLVDVLRLRMKILEMENTELLLADTKRTVRAQFNRLLNRPLDAEVVLGDSIHIESLPLPILEIPDSIIAHYPMLQMLAAAEAAFGASERMNRRMGFPMIGLGAQYGILRPRVGNTNPMNGRDMWMPMVSMNLPIWRKKYRASVAEAGLKRQAAAEALLETQNAVMVTYEEAMKDYQDAQRRRTLFVKQTLLAEEALNILMASYGAGGDDFEEVLQIQQSLLNYRLANVKATVEQNVSVARLERLMGR